MDKTFVMSCFLNICARTRICICTRTRAAGLFLLMLLLGACGRPSGQGSSGGETARSEQLPAAAGQVEVRVLTDSTRWATDPYLTEDQNGNPVLCWTEKPRGNGQYQLKYAIFDTSGAVFLPPVAVTSSEGTRTSAESAARVAFKPDGTILALFGKRFDDPANRFAGAIQYSLSTDRGASWSAPRYLHSDTAHQYGRGFFDIAPLAGGELGAVWLDGRYGEADTGSALFFARTVPGGGFGPDKMIGQSTCECCRTDLLVDSAGVIHVAYRDILFPPDRMGRQVRDMVYTRSVDNGVSFCRPARISADNWEVEGCPHAGPSLASAAGGIRVVWFTAGGGTDEGLTAGAGGAGVYQASLGTGRNVFSPRQLLSSRARHPQLIDLAGGRFATAWDETTVPEPVQQHVHGATDRHGHIAGSREQTSGRHGQSAGGSPAIVLQLTGPAGEKTSLHLTDGSYAAHHPVLASLASGKLLLAWIAEINGTSAIAYSLLELPQPEG